MSGKHAKLQVTVRGPGGTPVHGAQVHLALEGSEGCGSHHGETNAEGEALIVFELPGTTNAETTLLISAEHQTGTGHHRFALRAKTRVVSK